MPGIVVFHIGNILALDSLAGDQRRFVRNLLGLSDGCLNLRNIVAVDFLYVPMESIPFIGNGIQAAQFGDLAAGLMVVQIGKNDEVAGLELCSGHGSFPG